jgi:superfamily II DNA or RNA helicase
MNIDQPPPKRQRLTRPASWCGETHTNGFHASSQSGMEIEEEIAPADTGSWTIDHILHCCPVTIPPEIRKVLMRMKDNDVRSAEIETLLTTPFFFPAALSDPFPREIKERLEWWNKHLKARDKVQNEAKKKIIKAFVTDNKPRALMEVACGAGKTHIAIDTTEELIRTAWNDEDEVNIIVFEPTLELIRQTVRKWNAFFLRNEREEGTHDVQVVTVCSLTSLNQKKNRKKAPKGTKGASSDETNTEECDITGAQLQQALQKDKGLPKEWSKVIKKSNNSSDPIVQLKNFLSAENFDNKPIVRVVFVCYLSSSGISDALESMTKNERVKFDFGIFDEAHVTATKEIDNDSAREYQIGLKDEKIGIAHRLFMTATANVKSAKDLSVRDEGAPKDGKPSKKSEENIVINMKDNVEVYGGQPVYELNLTDAIEQSIVCDYQLAVVCMTGSEWSVHDIGRTVSVTDCDVSLTLEALGLSGTDYPNYARNHPTQEHPSALEIAQIYGFLDVCKKKTIEKAFTFHGTIPQSRRIQKIANHLRTKDRDIPNDHKFEYVDSKDDNMTKVLKTFKASTSRAWLSNPRTLAVGIDAPSMEGVAIMSSMSSSVNIAQILGRPLRMDPNNRKKQAYIMLPYFVDEMDHATESENTELWDNTSSRNTGPSTSGSGSKQRKERWYKKYTWEGTWDHESGLSALKEFCDEKERVPMYSKPKGKKTEKDEIEKENRLASFMHSMRKKWLKKGQSWKTDSNDGGSTDTTGAAESMDAGAAASDSSTSKAASGGVPAMVLSHWEEKQGDNTSSQRKFANIFAALSSIDSRMRHVRDGQQRAMVMLDKCLRAVFAGSELATVKRGTNAEQIERLRQNLGKSGSVESAVGDLDEVESLCKAFSERVSISQLHRSGTSISLATLKDRVKGRLVEISGTAFDGRAEELVDKLKTIIFHAGKEGKTEFQTRKMDDFTIEVSEDGIITNIDARATYYFGELDSDGGLPENASDRKDKNIGNKIINSLKGKVQLPGGTYYGHELTSWRNLTKGILSDDILPKETKPKQVKKK